jgi:hypothetical protein
MIITTVKSLQYKPSPQNTLSYNTNVFITAVKSFTLQIQLAKHTILQHQCVYYSCKKFYSTDPARKNTILQYQCVNCICQKLYSKCSAHKNILSYNARVLIDEQVLDTIAGKQLS